jgi:hypothetical protein
MRQLTSDPGPAAAAATLRQGGSSVARSGWFAVLARAGFVARAAVYLVIGVLAIKVALGAGGKLTGQQGAFKTIVRQPFGHLLLILVAVALGGYSLWRLLRAAVGHGQEDSDSGFERVSAAASGVVYALLCAVAVSILVERGSSGGGSSGNTQKAAGGVLSWPGGPWIVGIAGGIVIALGLYQVYRGISRDFLDDSKTEKMGSFRTWFEWSGLLGYCARGAVFALVGVFLIDAAATYDPAKAVGLDGALAKLAQHSFGPFLLGLVAAGLIAFGLYSLADSRYHRI